MKNLYISEIQLERIISNNNHVIAILSEDSNTREEVTCFQPLSQTSLNEFWDEAFHGVIPLDDYHLPFKSKPPSSFDMSCDEYIEIFNNSMSTRSRAFNYLEKRPPRSFKNSYIFKKGGVLVEFLAHWVLQTKRKYHSWLVSMDFKIKDLSYKSFTRGSV